MNEEIKNQTEEQAAEETAEPVKETRKEKKQAAKLEEKIAQLEEEAAKQEDRYKRILAEYDNFRKRSQKEKDSAYTTGKADTLSKLLPVYDNLERAMHQPPEDAAYKKGVEMTMTELLKIFGTLGVEIFGNVGDAFDPNLHNAVMHIENEELEENSISAVFQKGFKIGDKVVRFAMVQVAN